MKRKKIRVHPLVCGLRVDCNIGILRYRTLSYVATVAREKQNNNIIITPLMRRYFWRVGADYEVDRR